jgi:predicted peptidase
MRRILKAAGLPAVALLSLLISPFAAAEVLDRSATINGTTLRYKVVVPRNFDPAKAYPAVLAFPPGGQGMDLVDATLNSVYRAQAEQRGYIVVEPAAPNGVLFFEGSKRVFPAFLTKLLGDYKILDNKFHVAGNSNGGLSAFLVAAKYPQFFWSVTGFPGFLEDATPQQTSALAKLCIHMFAGELDSGWPDEMRQQAAKFRASGYNVTFAIEKGQPHVIATLARAGAARLFDQFDQARQGRCAK